jgi:hypothetical protein
MQFIFKHKITVLVGGLLVLAAAGYAVQWKWQVWPTALQNRPPAEENPLPEDNILESEDGLPETAAGIREVLSANLFGQANVAKKMLNNSGVVPKTQQPVELHGIVFIPQHPEQAVALIAQAGGVAQNYSVGQEILPFLPGWKVSAISPESVQIEHDGTVELLELTHNTAQSNASPAAANPAAQFDNVQPPLEDLQPPQDEAQPPQDDPQLPTDNAIPAPNNVLPSQNNAQSPQGNVPPPAIEPAAQAQE